MNQRQKQKIKELQKATWQYYKKNGRVLPWRAQTDPYSIVISEIMLQQTQVPRVIEKFHEFMSAFPNFEALARASEASVLRRWQGLGYNRRGLYVKRIATIVTDHLHGELPRTPEELERLPGIGPNTARSIAAFAFDIPTPFIETNIRTVFIHHLFPRSTEVRDTQLMPLIAAALPRTHAREWYWALMDYGTFLKKEFKNPSRKSAHHTKQTKFEGSHRQVRGAVLRTILKGGIHSAQSLATLLSYEERGVQLALDQLLTEGFIKLKNGGYCH